VTFSKKDLADYAKHLTGTDRVEEMIGYPIAIGGDAYQPKQKRILLGGDAAGMTDRLLGEGITTHRHRQARQARSLPLLSAKLTPMLLPPRDRKHSCAIFVPARRAKMFY